MKNWKIGTRLVTSYSLLMALLAGSLTGVFYQQLRHTQRQQTQETLLQTLNLTSPQIDSEYHSLIVSPEDTRLSYYAITQSVLERVQTTNENILSIFTVRCQSGTDCSYVLDYRPQEAFQPNPVGSDFARSLQNNSADDASAWVEWDIQMNRDDKPVVYGFVPIVASFGRVDGYLGIELNVSQVIARERQVGMIALGTFLGVSVIGLGFVRSLGNSLVVKPILALNDAAKQLASGQLASGKWEHSLSLNRKDEFGELAQAFQDMANQLNASFQQLTDYSQNLEQKVQARTEELDAAKQRAESANQAKSDFLANMSHELRTPLNGILGYAQILKRTKTLPEKERNGIDIIYKCGAHLLTLINDVLDLSKIEARKLELAPVALHVPTLLQSVVEMCKIKAEQKGIDFIYRPSTRLPEGIEADEKRLRQVLINLLGNAIKFTDSGSVTLQVDVLSRSDSQAKVLFQVIDTGVGIAKGDRHKLFESFEQVGDRKKQAEGTGLGLAISQRIVKLMGSEINVKSQLGEGSEFCFVVELPVACDWVSQQAQFQGVEQIVGYKGTQKQILIVDDRWENRTVIANLLSPLGFEIIEAEHGAEGLENLQAQSPNLVITDMAMPVMDGFEFLRQIRASNHLKHHKVIISSALVAQVAQQMAIDDGGDGFLAKPVDAAELFKLLAHHLQLEWVFEEKADNLEAQPTDLVLPAKNILEALLALAKDADMVTLETKTKQLLETDISYKPFVASILKFTEKFMAEEVEQLLQQYLAEELTYVA
ncbi:MAG: ATP-binding protein [Cyanobacteria bacterium J06649_5]